MIDDLISIIFTPLWPLGIVFPIITTIIMFHKCKRLIVYVPIISTATWLIVRIVLLWDVFYNVISKEQNTSDTLDIPLGSLIIRGTMGLTLVVLTLSILSTWVTYKVLKKIYK